MQDKKKGIITVVSLHTKLSQSKPIYIPPRSFPSRSFCPRLEVQNSKLAKELGHLVQWDGTTLSQSKNPPIKSPFHIPIVCSSPDGGAHWTAGPSGFFPTSLEW
jgi:hypothetical protein